MYIGMLLPLKNHHKIMLAQYLYGSERYKNEESTCYTFFENYLEALIKIQGVLSVLS